ncbi:MAG: MFS transporter, partial [Ginsengibacter sp.]
NFWLSFILLVVAGGAMYAPYGPFFAIITEILPSNVSGGAIALINSFGALGSFLGAYLVGYLNGSTGGFDASYIFMSVSLLLSAIITMIAVKDSGNMAVQKAPTGTIDKNLATPVTPA